MRLLTNVSIGAVLLVLAPFADASIYTISDDRIRSLDINPVLGRGYSIMTNNFQSTCLMVDQATTPSYNYDYYYSDFTKETDEEAAISSKLATSFGFATIFAGSFGSFSQSYNGMSKSQTRVYSMAATMRIERYYSSVREEVSPLSADATKLLTDQDYVGFFKACGPNYVRSIRRAQEVATLFQFKSVSRENASEFATSVMAGGYFNTGFAAGGGFSATSSYGRSKFKSQNSSLTITITGYGLGLTQDGSETMVAQSLEDFNKVMKFAFDSMTRAEGSHKIGMIYGIEVVPWVHNTKFQFHAKLQSENLEIPIARSMIPRSILKTKSQLQAESLTLPGTLPGSYVFDLVAVENRKYYRCKNANFQMDKFGFCCENEQLYDVQTKRYRTTANMEPEKDVCKPLRSVDRSILKDNMVNNGEFVARMEAAFRYKLVQMGSLEKCISAVNAEHDKYLFNYLREKDTVLNKKALPIKLTAMHLKMAIDPKSDYTLLKHMGMELDEWAEQFYAPCLGALFGMNIGSTPGTDVSFFMAYPWYSHDECMKLSCLTPNVQWDRDVGGCSPSLINGITGDNDKKYDANKDSNCARSGMPADIDDEDSVESCKNPQELFKENRDKLNTDCWENLGDLRSSVFYLIENYCNPQLTEAVMPWTEDGGSGDKESLAEAFNKCNNRSDEMAIPETKEEEEEEATPGRRRLSANQSSANERNALDLGVEEDEFIANLKRRIEFSRNGAYTK